jgi:hypothetical protein
MLSVMSREFIVNNGVASKLSACAPAALAAKMVGTTFSETATPNAFKESLNGL